LLTTSDILWYVGNDGKPRKIERALSSAQLLSVAECYLRGVLSRSDLYAFDCGVLPNEYARSLGVI